MKTFFFSLFVALHFPIFSQSWQQQPDFPGLERDDAVAVSIGSTAYYGIGFGAGFICLDDWWRFDNVNGWQQKTSFPGTARQYAAAATAGNFVYVFGGIDQNLISLNDLWRYNTENDQWEQLSSLPSNGRQAPMLIGLQDKLMLGMGRDYAASLYFNDVWMYYPATDSFEEMSSYPGNERYYPAFANVAGNAVVSHGKNQTECFDDCMYYSFSENEWISFVNSSHAGCNYVAAASDEYHFYIGGGLNASNDFLNTYYALNISENSWENLPDLPSIPRKGASMFVTDGDLYVIGGIDSNFTRLKEVWKYETEKAETESLKISPNPASDRVSIYLDESLLTVCQNPAHISLYDISGKLVSRNEISGKNFESWFSISVSLLKPGMYIVSIQDCEEKKSGKLIVE